MHHLSKYKLGTRRFGDDICGKSCHRQTHITPSNLSLDLWRAKRAKYCTAFWVGSLMSLRAICFFADSANFTGAVNAAGSLYSFGCVKASSANFGASVSMNTICILTCFGQVGTFVNTVTLDARYTLVSINMRYRRQCYIFGSGGCDLRDIYATISLE